MRYNPRARLDPGQVRVRRGRSTGGSALGRNGVRVGGGLGGLLVLVLVLVLQGQLGGGPAAPGPQAAGGGGTAVGSLEGCRTGADAQRDEGCSLLADVNSVQAFWERALPRQTGISYRPAVTTVFRGSVSTACGPASSAVGPFYCPADQGIYLDPGFFEDMLEGRLGARGGDFSEAYVIAHEYGHHVQNLTGQMQRVRSRQGSDSDAVRLELQADCYAGMWARSALRVPDEGGQPFLLELTRDDIARAVDAARAVGDDRIQSGSGNRVDPDLWTHGSAEQRMAWFRVGLDTGSLEACDTFAAGRL